MSRPTLDAFYVAAILGHVDLNTSQVYTAATNADLRRAMKALTLVGPWQIDAIVPTQEERPPMAAAVNR